MAGVIAVADRIERAMLSEAVIRSSAQESIGRRLGDELIAAARATVAAWYTDELIARERRLAVAVSRLERLVGRP